MLFRKSPLAPLAPSPPLPTNPNKRFLKVVEEILFGSCFVWHLKGGIQFGAQGHPPPPTPTYFLCQWQDMFFIYFQRVMIFCIATSRFPRLCPVTEALSNPAAICTSDGVSPQPVQSKNGDAREKTSVSHSHNMAISCLIPPHHASFTVFHPNRHNRKMGTSENKIPHHKAVGTPFPV